MKKGCCKKTTPKNKKSMKLSKEFQDSPSKTLKTLEFNETSEFSLISKEWDELENIDKLKFSNCLNGWSSRLYIQELRPEFQEIKEGLNIDLVEILKEDSKGFTAKGMRKDDGKPIIVQGIIIERCDKEEISSELGMNKVLLDSLATLENPSVPKLYHIGTHEFGSRFNTCHNILLKISEGGPMPLDKLLRIKKSKGKLFTSAELAFILIPIAKLLDKLEKLHIFFEYLSPEMFFIGTRYDKILLTDLGSAFYSQNESTMPLSRKSNYPEKFLAPELAKKEYYKPSLSNSYYFGQFIAAITGAEEFSYEELHIHCLQIVKNYPVYGSHITSLLSLDPKKRIKISSLIPKLQEEADKIKCLNERESCKIAQYHIYKEDSTKKEYLERMIRVCMNIEMYKKARNCISELKKEGNLTPEMILTECNISRNLKEYENCSKLLKDSVDIFKKLDETKEDSLRHFIEYYLEFAALKFDEEDYRFGLNIMEKALGLCQSEPNKTEKLTPIVFLVMGIFSENLGKFEDSFNYYGKAFDAKKKIVGESHPGTLSIQYLYAQSQIKIGKANDGIEQLKSCLEKKKEIYESTHDEIMFIYILLGVAYTYKGEISNAKEYFKKIITDSARADSIIKTMALSNLANLDAYDGSYLRSIEYYEKCIEMLAKKNPDRNTNEIADIFNNIGCCQMELGTLQTAEDNFDKCLDIKKALFGDDSTKVFPAIYNFGRIFHERKEFDKAKVCYENSLNLLADNIDNLGLFEFLWHKVSIQDNLALLICQIGSINEGMDLINESIRLRGKINNFGLNKSKMIKAYILYQAGELEEAKVLNIEILEKTEDGSEFMYCSNNLAHIYIELKDFNQALKIIEQATNACDEILKNGNSRIKAALLNNKGVLLMKQQKFQEAQNYFEKSLIMKSILEGNSDIGDGLNISKYNMSIIDIKDKNDPFEKSLKQTFNAKLVQSNYIMNEPMMN